MRLVLYPLAFLTIIFILPALMALAWWTLQDRPTSWRRANWESSGLLPEPDRAGDAAVYVLAARTGGLKGALSVHSWIVTKARGATRYDRYDKVGWGSPVRRNGYAADARWYSNEPWIVRRVTGVEAEALIPKIEQAIAAYPYSHPGDYRIWPGPNSNSFVAYVVDTVPELGARMPANATGRDFAPGYASLDYSRETGDLHASLGGFVGVSVGYTRGLEINFLGLVAGVDITEPALKIPGFGTISLPGAAEAGQ